MSASGSRQGKKSKKDSYVPERECTHAYCHRDTIDSDKPIGLPWASGRLRHYPGQGPPTVEQYMLENIKKLIEKLKQKDTTIPEVCPPIIENVLVEKPEARRAITDEMSYLFNFVLEVGDQDVKEYLNKFKEDKKKSEEEKKEEDKEEKEPEEKGEEEDEGPSEEPPAEAEEVIAEEPAEEVAEVTEETADEPAAGDAPPVVISPEEPVAGESAEEEYLPWASGRLKALPGDSPIVVCTGYEPEQKVRPKRKKKCECKQEVIKKRDPFEYCYPEYIDLCDTCLVNEELIFFLNLIAVGDSHYEKELERNKQADEEAEKERKECLKRKKEAGQETEDEEKEDEETEDEEEKDDEEKEDEEKKEEEKKEDEE